MQTLQRALSDLLKLFFGPHAEEAPDLSWGRILYYLAAFLGLVLLVNWAH